MLDFYRRLNNDDTLLKVEENGPEVEAEEAVLWAAFVMKVLYPTVEGGEFKQPTVLSEQTENRK